MNCLIKYINKYDFYNQNKYELYLDMNNKILFITFYKNFRNDKIFCDILDTDTLRTTHRYIELNSLKKYLEMYKEDKSLTDPPKSVPNKGSSAWCCSLH